MSVFDKFKLLKMDMMEKGWIIEAFPFKFKQYDYIVLAKLYSHGEKKPIYSIMKVEVLNRYNIDERLIAPVNSNGFIIDAKSLRKFFKIEYGENLRDIISQFNEYFARFIPVQVNLDRTKEFEQVMISSLSQSDSQNSNKLYCNAVKRNHEGQKRTPFNDNKTRLLRPELYEVFKSDYSISFCYSTDANDAKTDDEIIASFTNR